MRDPLRMATSRTTMMTNLVQKDIDKQKLLIPTEREQEKLGNFYKAIEILINKHEHSLRLTLKLKKFLLQKLFI